MPEFNRHQFPKGGWQFYQPQTKWSAPTPLGSTFDQTVIQILQHRHKNLAIVAKYNLSLDKWEIGNELEAFTRKRLGIVEPAPSFPQGHRSVLARVVVATEHIKRAAQGTAVILDWLTSGGAPVAQELAEKRAAVCATCPKNVSAEWFTVAPAETIKATLEARKDLKLETKHDAELQSCDVCRCLMRLKVWVPLHHIVEHTKSEILAEFPSHCWIATRDQ